jgi:dTDP-4-dehydrorhamnose reductase
MKLLILGAGGMLGRALAAAWRNAHQTTAARSADADVRQRAEVHALLRRVKPDATILAAGLTDVDRCEREPELAYAINAQGAEHVARACADVGSHLVYISTDYVFDGEQDAPYEVTDAKRPLSHYAASKSEGEDRVLAALPSAAVVRVAWLFGDDPKCFPARVLAQSATEPEIRAVDDKWGAPLYVNDASAPLLRLIAARAAGIFHLTNSGRCSWYDMAAELLRTAGRDQVHLVPIKMKDVPWQARRPRNTVLSLASLAPHGIVMRPWQNAMQEFVEKSMVETGHAPSRSASRQS